MTCRKYDDIMEKMARLVGIVKEAGEPTRDCARRLGLVTHTKPLRGPILNKKRRVYPASFMHIASKYAYLQAMDSNRICPSSYACFRRLNRGWDLTTR